MIENAPLKREPDAHKVWTYSLYYDENPIAEELGIHILTGEACALGMRLLCELEPKAMQLFLNYYGLHVSLDSLEKSPWNHKNWFALFLDRSTIQQLTLFYLCSHFPVVFTAETQPRSGFANGTHIFCAENMEDITHYRKDSPTAFGHWDDTLNEWVEGTIFKDGRTYMANPNQPRQGFSNVHAFTGISQ